ncbi:hypothetical protein ACFQHO_41800 [Actinomadura yumaensis]|uniref:hypothetical protein n=1 Tax=Actinomadura yumaensis TaxID=111807 RepID=UPI00361C29CA
MRNRSHTAASTGRPLPSLPQSVMTNRCPRFSTERSAAAELHAFSGRAPESRVVSSSHQPTLCDQLR